MHFSVFLFKLVIVCQSTERLIEMFQLVFFPRPYGIYSTAHIVNAHSIRYGRFSLRFPTAETTSLPLPFSGARPLL